MELPLVSVSLHTRRTGEVRQICGFFANHSTHTAVYPRIVNLRDWSDETGILAGSWISRVSDLKLWPSSWKSYEVQRNCYTPSADFTAQLSC